MNYGIEIGHIAPTYTSEPAERLLGQFSIACDDFFFFFSVSICIWLLLMQYHKNALMLANIWQHVCPIKLTISGSFWCCKQPEKDHRHISSALTMCLLASYNYWHTFKLGNCVTRQITTHICRSRVITVLKPESYVGHCSHKPWHWETITCRTKGQERAGLQLKQVQPQPLTFLLGPHYCPPVATAQTPSSLFSAAHLRSLNWETSEHTEFDLQ